jgi:hypothetical protein
MVIGVKATSMLSCGTDLNPAVRYHSDPGKTTPHKRKDNGGGWIHESDVPGCGHFQFVGTPPSFLDYSATRFDLNHESDKARTVATTED